MVRFQGKYEVLSALSDGESQSFRARQISSGRPVIVHHLAASRTLPPQPDLASLIFRFLRSASAEEGRNFLDMGEEDGRIFVVTADVPECSDLRKWLQSVAEARSGKEGDAQPAAKGTPDLGNIVFTRAFTTEALRQFSHFPVSKPVPPSPGPGAAQPSVSPPEKSPGELIPSSEIPAASIEVHRSRSDGVYPILGEILAGKSCRTPGSHFHASYFAEKLRWSCRGPRGSGGLCVEAGVLERAGCSHRTDEDSPSAVC